MATIDAGPVPQHLAALAKANAVRLARAELKRRVASGDLPAAEVVADPPECAVSMTVGELLDAQLRWGETRVRKLCAEVGVPETKALGTFTMRQRIAFAAALPDGGRVAAALRARDEAARRARKAPCSRMNGQGPCLRPEGHARSCVVAVHAPALGYVYFRRAVTGELLHAVEVHLGGPCPSRGELVALLAQAETSHERRKGPS